MTIKKVNVNTRFLITNVIYFTRRFIMEEK